MTEPRRVPKEGTEALNPDTPASAAVPDFALPSSLFEPDGLTPGDLADIMRSLTAVTERLQSAHSGLQDEVVRLRDQLRQKDEQLIRSRQLAALGQMAAGIAHEVRNPLGSISLCADMLAQDLAEHADMHSLAVKIGRAVRDLDRIVFDVLSFARESKPRLMSVSVDDLLERALDGCRALLLDSRIQVVRSVSDSALTLELQADAPMLAQGLINLIRNAVQAMEPGGTLSIDVHTESDAQSDAAPIALSISIADTGPGFAPDALAHAFDPFYTTRASGTGLGLAIVHRIIDAHAGSIRLANRQPGPGAVVHLSLPAAPAPAPRDVPLVAVRPLASADSSSSPLQGCTL